MIRGQKCTYNSHPDGVIRLHNGRLFLGETLLSRNSRQDVFPKSGNEITHEKQDISGVSHDYDESSLVIVYELDTFANLACRDYVENG